MRAFCHECGVENAGYDWTEFHGVSWEDVATRIVADHGLAMKSADAARRLHELWEQWCIDSPPEPIPGARRAVIAAHARMATAIVSSSFRAAIDATIRQMDIAAFVAYRAGADDYARSKPAPDGFLHAAAALQIEPASCLVFEDSLAGLQSARAAGMAVIAVTHRSNVAAQAADLADRAITDFTCLEAGFFDALVGAGQV